MDRRFIVEKILEKRVRFGKIEYLLKWQGFPESSNSWQSVEDLECPELIKEFEDRLAASDSNGNSGVNNNSPKRKNESETIINKKKKSSSAPFDRDLDSPLRGFDRGLEPEKILGATDSKGELMFLMKWKNSDEADLVPSRIANIRCPQIVIKFYEERLMWHSNSSTNNSNNNKNNSPVSTTTTTTTTISSKPAIGDQQQSTATPKDQNHSNKSLAAVDMTTATPTPTVNNENGGANSLRSSLNSSSNCDTTESLVKQID